MKAYHFILVFGLAGLLLPGCSTAPHQPPTGSAADKGAGGVSPPPLQLAKGNADALAHYAAGESYLDNDDAPATLRQWEAAVLEDPANERLVTNVVKQLLQAKENDRALALLSKSASRTNASAMILSFLARLQLQEKHFKQALAASKLAIQRQPDEFDGYECQVLVLLEQKQWAEAAKTLKTAARQVRPEPGLLLNVVDLFGLYLRNQPKDDEAETAAVAVLDRIAQMKSNSIPLWDILASHYARMNQEKKAEDIYTRLLTNAPERSALRDEMHAKLAELYMQSEDHTNAVKELKALIRSNPTGYPRAWFFLGELTRDTGNLADAADDFSHALHEDAGFEQAYYDLALVQVDLHHQEDAFDTLRQARNLFAKTFSCEFYTGIVYAHVKNYAEAIRYFKEAEVIGLATHSARLNQSFYLEFGAACEQDHSYKQAEEYLQKSITLAPDYAQALNYLGYMLADRGEQLPRARALIEKAVNLEPRNGAFLDSLGWVLFKLNQPHQALPQLLKAIQYTSPPDATVLDHLGEVYRALHQIDKALEAWKKSYAIEASDEVKHKIDQFSGGTH
jgi:tetratricopeptide (TPR) repeat protein